MGFFDSVKKATKGVLVDPVVDLAHGEIGKSFADAWQNSPGGQVVSAIGKAPEKIAAEWKGIQGQKHKSHKADDLAQVMKDQEEEQYGKNQEYNKEIGSADDAYLGSMQGNVAKYQGDLDKLRGEIEGSQTDAKNTYSNQIQPRLKNLMESAQKNSSGAMSLQDAMDPNNAVATKTRQLYADQGTHQRNDYNDEALRTRDQYNQQGAGIQNQYNQQAKNEGKAGLADVGVLGALGMQNMAGQLGNVPMTGGQLQAMMGANQAQSGAAYAQTQQRMNSLRDQGIQGNISRQNQGLDTATQQRGTGLSRAADLNTQGLQQGFNRSDTAYGQGLDAQDRYKGSIGDFEGAADRQQARDADFRGQRGNNAGQSYGLQQSMTDATRGVGNAKTQRDMAIYNTHMGGKQANIAGDISGINAKQAAGAAQTTGALQAGGTVAGAYFGGPAGAAAGNQAGQAAGNAAAPDPNQIPSTPNYGNGFGGEAPQQQQQGLSLANGTGATQARPAKTSRGSGFQQNPYAYAQPQKKAQNRNGSQGARR